MNPDHDDSVFTGSLGPVTTEGYDPCHEEQLSGMEPVCQPGREPLSPAETSPGLPLGWTGNDIVRGIVMSEILNRKHLTGSGPSGMMPAGLFLSIISAPW